MRIRATSIGVDKRFLNFDLTTAIILKTRSTTALLIGKERARKASFAKSSKHFSPFALVISLTAIQKSAISTLLLKFGEIS